MKMPKDLKEKWVAALRSGEYNQTNGRLYRPSTNGYCCLGVLECVADGKVTSIDEEGIVMGMPLETFYERHNIDPAAVEGTITDARLASLNDDGSDFREIADLIEEKVLTTD